MAPISAGGEAWVEMRVQNTCAESVRYLRPLAPQTSSTCTTIVPIYDSSAKFGTN